MNPGILYLYAGRVEEWTKEEKEEKNRESLCGRLLLLYGLWELGYRELFQEFYGREDTGKVLKALEANMAKGPYGKPYLPKYPEIHFNISHSGGWGVCALASVPCGVDIQEIRPVKSQRMVERTMNQEEQAQIQQSKDPSRTFTKLWAYKESCIKLSGQGLRQDMKNLEPPACYRFFWLEENLAGCVSAEQPFALEIRRPAPENLLS